MVLNVIVLNKKILLAEKATGIGAGLLNGPGGKVEISDASLVDACIRETREELGIQCVPGHMALKGINHFTHMKIDDSSSVKFVSFETFRVWVFVTMAYTGTIKGTDEMKNPQWYSIYDIPYERMWTSDREWMKYLLGSESFFGSYIFSAGNKLVESKVSAVDKIG